jgi:hypothetical protein
MEQQLINNLICFIRKAGGESFIKNLLVNGDNANRVWTADEIAHAVDHTQWVNDFFGQSDAAVVISKLLEIYHIDVNDLSLRSADQ